MATKKEWNSRPGRSSSWISRNTRQRIYARDHNQCVYCGSMNKLTLDHFKPRNKGGNNAPSNLITACYTCNSRRQMTPVLTYLCSVFGNSELATARYQLILSTRKRKLPNAANTRA